MGRSVKRLASSSSKLSFLLEIRKRITNFLSIYKKRKTNGQIHSGPSKTTIDTLSIIVILDLRFFVLFSNNEQFMLYPRSDVWLFEPEHQGITVTSGITSQNLDFLRVKGNVSSLRFRHLSIQSSEIRRSSCFVYRWFNQSTRIQCKRFTLSFINKKRRRIDS